MARDRDAVGGRPRRPARPFVLRRPGRHLPLHGANRLDRGRVRRPRWRTERRRHHRAPRPPLVPSSVPRQPCHGAVRRRRKWGATDRRRRTPRSRAAGRGAERAVRAPSRGTHRRVKDPVAAVRTLVAGIGGGRATPQPARRRAALGRRRRTAHRGPARRLAGAPGRRGRRAAAGVLLPRRRDTRRAARWLSHVGPTT